MCVYVCVCSCICMPVLLYFGLTLLYEEGLLLVRDGYLPVYVLHRLLLNRSSTRMYECMYVCVGLVWLRNSLESPKVT